MRCPFDSNPRLDYYFSFSQEQMRFDNKHPIIVDLSDQAGKQGRNSLGIFFHAGAV